ncbi:MAG: ATP-binding protein [Burkholderiales bacterium]
MARIKATLGSYLVALVMLAVIPLMLIAGVLIWRQTVLQRQAFERSLLQTAQALSLAVDRHLFSDRVMLETLAQSQFLERGDIRGFYALASRVIGEHGGLFISLFDDAGRQVFNTLRPPGEALPTPFEHPPPPDPERPPLGDPSAMQEVLRTGKPVNSDLVFGLVAGRLLFTINVPVMRNGRIRYVLNAGFEPAVMTRLLQENKQFSGVPAWIWDRRGFIVGRWQNADAFYGRRVPPQQLEQLRARSSGVAKGESPEGMELYYSYARSPVTGWTASVGAERGELDRAVRAGWIVGGALMVGGLLLGLLLALSIAARLRRSIVSLAAAASRNEPPRALGLRTREIELLEHAVLEAAQAREARLRREQAEAESRTKDRYIATLSHELRNPLAALSNAVHLLGMAGRERENIRPTLDMMQRQIAQLTRMVNDLLDVSRVTHGKITLRLAPTDLAAVLAQAIETAAPALQAKRLRLARDLGPGSLMVSGDPARLMQVFSNLLDNAAKFTPSGGEVSVSLAREGAEALAVVSDNGVGIDPAFLPTMFEPFTQADTSLERATSGLGLGLALARQIVEAHGGTLAATSEGRGRGSRLTVRIPLV